MLLNVHRGSQLLFASLIYRLSRESSGSQKKESQKAGDEKWKIFLGRMAYLGIFYERERDYMQDGSAEAARYLCLYQLGRES